MANNAILYDASCCTACKGCQIACKQWNQLPSPMSNDEYTFSGSLESPLHNDGNTWLHIGFREEFGGPNGIAWAFSRVSCQHCTNAACVSACPSGACHYTESGAVVIDPEVCIGCKYCAAACPFDVPKYSEREGVSRKCWMCEDRTAEGQTPACVKTCPAGALKFGERDEILAAGHARLDAVKGTFPDAVLYGENEMGGLHVIQVLPFGAEAHGMPLDPQVPLLRQLSDLLKPAAAVGAAVTVAALAVSFFRSRGYERHPDEYRYDPELREMVRTEHAASAGSAKGDE